MTSIKDDSSTDNKNRQMGHKSKERRETPGIETAYRLRKFVQCIHLKKNLIKAGHDGTQLLKESASVQVQSYPDLHKVSQAS